MPRLLVITILALAATGCGSDDPDVRPARERDSGVDTVVPDAPTADVGQVDIADAAADPASSDTPLSSGAELYGIHCERCHGPNGEGGVGQPINDWSDGLQALVARIDETMPPGQAADCAETCAEDVAAYVLTLDADAPLECDAPVYGPRQLRLLNRREYENSVRDLLGVSIACVTDAACPTEAPVCDGGRCAERACGFTLFEFDPREREPSFVVVAGSFNSWSGTADGGGWPMREDPDGIWRLETTLEPGTHGYKYVVNGVDWFADPDAERFEDDGFGGQNSLIDVECAEAADPFAGLTERFPPEVRPSDFGFDTHADSARVNATRLVEFLDAAEVIADALVAEFSELLGCSGRSACEAALLDRFAPRVFRRALTDAERARYAAQFAEESELANAIHLVVRTLFSSPHFLYRSEIGEASGGAFRLTASEVATALAYTFWGTAPDDALREAAASGQLDDRAGVEAEARRLLADPRARDLVAIFSVQWLGVEAILTANKSPELFPEVDDTLRLAMLAETRRFVTHVVFDGTGTFGELMTANYTFANARLAAIYGLTAEGADLTQTAYDGTSRAGLLGHAALLGTYSHSDQSSPIRRGLFVREHLLCQEFGAPPPNAGGVPEVDPDATTRERFAQHTADPFCASCHQYIDDLGFGFEAYDALGRHRTTDAGAAIDSSGNLNDIEGLGNGTSAPFETLNELGDLLAESEAAQDCFVRQFYRFARGHREDGETDDSSASRECAIAEVRARFAESGFDIIEMMVAAVTTDDFLMRR